MGCSAVKSEGNNAGPQHAHAKAKNKGREVARGRRTNILDLH